MLTKRWTPLREKGIIQLTGKRLEYWQDSVIPHGSGYPKVRNAVVDCGRRSLKTELDKRIIVWWLGYSNPASGIQDWLYETYGIRFDRDYEDYRLIYGAPTDDQVRSIAWNDIVRLTPIEWYKQGTNKPKINESRMTITTNWGAEIKCAGMDRPQRIEGQPIDGIILDESPDLKPNLWNYHVAPMMIDRHGWSRHIGVHDFDGVGEEDFAKKMQRAINYNDDRWKRYHWSSREVVPENEIAEMEQGTNSLAARQEIDGEMVDAPGRAYWEYNEARNVRKVEFVYGAPIFVTCDFNTEHHNWLLSQINIPDYLETISGSKILNAEQLPIYNFFDQLYLNNASTERMCNALLDMIRGLNAEYLTKPGMIQFYGDYSGVQRRSEADDTNWQQIENVFPVARDNRCFHYEPNPVINARLRKVNDALYSAAKIVRIYLSPRCEELKNDLQFVNRKDLFSSKQGARTHASDAAGYEVMEFDAKHLQVITGNGRSDIDFASLARGLRL